MLNFLQNKRIALIVAVILVTGLTAFGLFYLFAPQSEIVQTEAGLFRVAEAQNLQVRFGSKQDPSLITLKNGKSSLQLGLPLKEVQWEKKNGKLQADLGPYTFRYSLIRHQRKAVGLKEEIVIKERNPSKAIFKFPLSSNNLKLRKKEGIWRFYNQAGEEIFYIPKPFMKDAAGNKTEAVEIQYNDGFLIIKPDQEWLRDPQRKFPVTIDPSLKLTVLDVYSHPATGDTWNVEFETKGRADLKIIPDDQATIDDLEFDSLKCGDEKREPRILRDDVIHYPNWSCDKTAEVNHYVETAGKHTLKFTFGDEVEYAYNDPDQPTYDYSGAEVHDFTDATTSAFEKGGALPSSPSDYDSEATSSDYTSLESSDNSHWKTALASATGTYNSQIYQFTVDQNPATLGEDIEVQWEGFGTSVYHEITLKAYDYTNATWTDITTVGSGTTTDKTLSGTLSGNTGNYVNSTSTFSLMAAVSFTCGGNVTFTYDGEEVTYDMVSYDGRCWLDRNLGATTTASALDDSSGYGDLYQWGRCQDGHEFRYSNTTSQLATTTDCGPNAGHPWDGQFITPGSMPYDWLETQDDSLWASTTNKNDPCPDGWRVPTEAEWNSATSTGDWATSGDAIASPLKLPAAGYRFDSDGSLNGEGTDANYWSSNASSTFARYLNLTSSDVVTEDLTRASGISVRCIKQ